MEKILENILGKILENILGKILENILGEILEIFKKKILNRFGNYTSERKHENAIFENNFHKCSFLHCGQRDSSASSNLLVIQSTQ